MSVPREDIYSPSASFEKQFITEETGICTLNDDCLIHIFQYLPIVDRVRLERVCKRWLMISLNSWHNFKTLNFEKECWGFKSASMLEKINRRILKKILKRCGKFVVELEFSEFNKRLGPNILNVVAKFCPNVQFLNAADLEVSPWSLRALAYSCSKLISFSIGNCTDECDDELALMFEKNRKLRTLCVYSNFEVTGECLLQLNGDCIESIIFVNCPSISLDYFNVIRNFNKLNLLMLEHFHDSYNTMKSISHCSGSLRYLTLALCPFYSDTLHQIAKLANLESLDLSSNASVDDELLIAVAANCKLLHKVDITFCNAVTNLGLASIVSLPNLKYLFIEDLVNITDEVLSGMPNLRNLDCSYCPNVRDEGLAKLIESSENMEHLYLSHCRNISNNLLEAAVRATKKRRNNVVLKMHLSNTNLQLSKVSDTSPYLQVIPTIVVNHIK